MTVRPATAVLILAAACACASAAPASAQGPPVKKGADDLVVLRRCEVEYERSTSIGAPLGSVVQDCLVKPGDRVKAGQALGRVFDRDAQAELDLKRAAADSDVEIRLAEEKRRHAEATLQRADDLSKRGVVSAEEIDGHRSAAKTTAIDLENARLKHAMARIEARLAEALVLQRQFTSPHDGVVVEVLRHPGESVALLDPVFTVVKDDRVKVTGYVDVGLAWRVKQGQPVRIRPDVEGADLDVESEEFEGAVAFVDSRIDPENRTCKVVAEIDNRGLRLRSGLEARMEIFLGDGPPPAPRPRPRPAKLLPAPPPAAAADAGSGAARVRR